MYRIIVTTKDEQITDLIKYLLNDEPNNFALEAVFESIPEKVLEMTSCKELLLIDSEQIEGDIKWFDLLKRREKMKVLIHFNNTGRNVVDNLIHLLKQNNIKNILEFIILDNYSIDLKLILLRQELLELLSPTNEQND